MATPMEDVQGDQQTGSPLFLDVLSLTNEKRNEHGLRHQDYQRYRQYCAKKIHRVRKNVGLTQGKKKYEKKELTAEVASSDRHLEVLLFETERAWAYAMELKRDSTAEPRKKHHLIKRLKRAAQTATKLEGLCQERETETRTQLDVQAYAAFMEGSLLFEQQKWQDAWDKFATARTIYVNLEQSGGNAAQKVLCQAAIDEIDPNIRYCAYNLKLKGGQTMDIGELVAMRAQSGGTGLDLTLEAKLKSLEQNAEKGGAEMSLTWRGHVIPTKNGKLMETIAAAKHAADKLDTTSTADVAERLALFDKAIGAFWDATRLAEKDVREDAVATAKVKSSKSDENTNNLQLAFAYVSYLRVSRTIQRNLLLIEETERKLAQMEGGKKAAKPEDIVKLHDSIIQSVSEIQDMPGIQSDRSLQSILTTKVNLNKAKRVYHLARIYTSESKPAEALALYNRAEEYLTTAKAEADMVRRTVGAAKSGKGKAAQAANVGATADDAAELEVLDGELAGVQKALRRALVQEQARWYLEAHEKGHGVYGITKGVGELGLEEGKGEELGRKRSREDLGDGNADGAGSAPSASATGTTTTTPQTSTPTLPKRGRGEDEENEEASSAKRVRDDGEENQRPEARTEPVGGTNAGSGEPKKEEEDREGGEGKEKDSGAGVPESAAGGGETGAKEGNTPVDSGVASSTATTTVAMAAATGDGEWVEVKEKEEGSSGGG
ncbi:signal recognition particle subunit srp68 [Rhizophlyctis rosea]|nr:signal recognition particle subunit srp68 [Rhizophlyctis rosea]